jgi:hypothetical protein
MASTIEHRGLSRHEVVTGVLKGITELGTIGAACKQQGITTQTLWAWRQEDPDLDTLVKKTLDESLRDDLTDLQCAARSVKHDPVTYLTRAGPTLIQLAKARLPEYRSKFEVATSITLEIGPTLSQTLLGAVPEPEELPGEVVDVLPEDNAVAIQGTEPDGK